MSTSDTAAPVRLPTVPEAAAVGQTAELYARIRDHFGLGLVPDVFQLVSTRPSFLRVLFDGYLSMFAEGVLPREVKEMIATLVARENSCGYCVGAHTLLLELLGSGPEVVDAARSASIDEMPVDDKVRDLLRFVVSLTRHAYRVTDEDFDRLRETGWSDEQLLEAVWVAGLFNAIVRMVETLGLYHLGQLGQFGPNE
ncbi:MAG: peroxidase-related enzyme [Streptosporangiales bacterium]|nr:peroxidase-related enzyme [Streptosporangiales bacterium]